MAVISIDHRLCKGCSLCVEFCPRNVLRLGSEIDERGIQCPITAVSEKCTSCHLCEMYCPDFAIHVGD